MKSPWLLAVLIAASPAAAAPRMETAILAGGCFWTMEAVFEHVKGVTDVVSGMAGGTSDSTDRANRAEAVRISFDPSIVNYEDLLRIYFIVAHDPTQLNRQGPDIGARYRSAVFPQNAAQRSAAEKAIASLKRGGKAVVTRIEAGPFYLAPALHQDFWRKNPRHPYILAHDVPKIAALKRVFPASYHD